MKKILFIAALVGIALAGCKKNEKPELNVTPDELNFNYSAETKEVTVTANVDWTANTTADWITITPKNGSGNAAVNVSVSENTGSSERNTDVIVSQVGNGGLSTTLKIKQKAYPLELQLRRQDSLALVALYNTTNGDNWTNKTGWKTARLEHWYGITIEKDRVVEILLFDNQMAGSIPAEIGNLNQLTILDLRVNKLTGSIPIEIGNLRQLQGLYLFANQLTGNIPAEIGNLRQLQGLLLWSNLLTGGIPAEIGNLNHLEGLGLGYNQLYGEVPNAIINWVQSNPYWFSICPQQGAGFSNYSCP